MLKSYNKHDYLLDFYHYNNFELYYKKTNTVKPKDTRIVGITAGASTPKNIIEEVQNYVRRNF